MTQQQGQTIERLNDLYAAESRSLLARFAEAGAFVTGASLSEMSLIQRLAREQAEHLAWLGEAMDRCCGVIYPPRPDAHIGHLHYLDLHTLLPLAIRGQEELVRAYAAAAGQALTPPGGEVVSRILNRHQAHLEALRRLAAGSAASKPAGEAKA